MVLFPAEP